MKTTALSLIFILSLLIYSCDTSRKNRTGEMKKEELSSTSIDAKSLNTFTLEGLGFSIELPESWESEKNENAFIFKEDCNRSFCSNLIVSSAFNHNNLNMEQVVQSFVGSLGQKFKEVRVLGVTDKVICGFQFQLIDYKMFEQDTHLGGTIAFTINGDNIVSLNFMAENQPEGSYPERRKIFIQILNSIKS
jgi:hypothetical protein